MLMQLGPVTMDVIRFNTHEYSRSSETVFARKAIVGTRDILEPTGEGEERLEIAGKILPLHLGGQGELAALHAVRASAVPIYVMRGDGEPYGWYVIENIEEHSMHLHRTGVGQQVKFSVSMCRVDKPATPDIALNFLELFQ